MRIRPTPTQQPPAAGPFRIIITAVRSDQVTADDTDNPTWYSGEPTRDEQHEPEPVILTIPLRRDLDQAHAVERAAGVTAALGRCMGQQFLKAHRVKVVPAVPR